MPFAGRDAAPNAANDAGTRDVVEGFVAMAEIIVADSTAEAPH